MKYPKSVYFIVACEFCAKFSYFGLRTVLSLYLLEILRFPENTAVIVFHTFGMLISFFPLIGAMIADSWLGKYRTILYFGSISAFGYVLLAASSTPWFHLPVREISLLSLLILAFGSGGYRPCSLSFGSDQIKLPEQEDKLLGFVSLMHVAIISSSILSIFVLPILRKDVLCFGFNSCYPLAFLISSIMTILLVVIFFFGTSYYKVMKPEGNIVWSVVKCTANAIVRNIKSAEKHNHWLDNADEKYDRQLIEDIKAVFSILKLFIPLTVYWSVHDQQSSRWTYQATRMDGELFGYVIKPDQFHLVNSIMCLILIQILQYINYPIIEKILFINTSLKKMTVGGVLVATSFVITGILELKLEPSYAKQPSLGFAQIRIVNTFNCPVRLTLENQIQELEALDLYQNISIPVTGDTCLNFNVNIQCEHSQFTGCFRAEEKKSLTYLLKNNSLHFGFADRIEKSLTGDPKIRALILTDAGSPADLNLSIEGLHSYNLSLTRNQLVTEFIEVIHDSYDIKVDGIQMESRVPLKSGGVYMVVGQVSNDSKVIKTVTVVEPNSVHMVWQLPQFFVMALGEMIFVLTGLAFALNQAPVSMKSVVIAAWLLTSSVGNIIVVIIAKAHFFERQMYEFFLFAGLLYVDMLVFAVMAMFYKYVDNSSNKGQDKTTDEEETREGHIQS